MQDEEVRAASDPASLSEDIRRLLTQSAETSATSWPIFPAQLASTESAHPSSEKLAGSAISALAAQLVWPMLPSSTATAGSVGEQGWWNSIISPVIGTVLGLFGGGRNAANTDTALPEFVAPERLAYNFGFAPGEPDLFQVERNGEGQMRRSVAESRGEAPQVTIEVQAMDSQSFLDHRREIADAVRLALLESHQLQDSLSSNE